jgi:Secretion system C-terminal sorting domain
MNTKQRMKLFTKILIFSCFLLPIPTVSAQTNDTVHSRRGYFFLADSTQMTYEMCWIALNQGVRRHFLTFVDTTGKLPNNYYQTATFQASGFDTLAFNRFATFDDKNYYPAFSLDTSNTSAVISAYNSIAGADSAKEIIPSDTVFNGSSSVSFILQLCLASTGAVIANIDTLECFENLSGEMRYENFPTSFNIREHIALTGTVHDTLYYFKVLRIDNLPFGTTYHGYSWEEFPQNTGSEFYLLCQYEVGYPMPAGKIADGSKTSSPSALLIESLDPNPSNGNLTVQLISPQSAEVLLNVYDVMGRRVYARSAQIQKGNSTFSVDLSSLPSGQYVFEIELAGLISSKNFVVSK